MKNAEFTVEFIRHVLANGRGPNGERDVFERDGTNALIFHQTWWYSAFSRAIETSSVRGVKPSDIAMDLSVNAPTEKWNRHYGPNKSRLHESIMPGTKVTFKALVADKITESNLAEILERMGRFVGISPYGHKLGFGRFKVIDVVIESSETNQVNQPTPI